MEKPFNFVRAKSGRSRHQGNLIRGDTVELLKKESDNTLSDEDIKKFRLLIAREPVIKKIKQCDIEK